MVTFFFNVSKSERHPLLFKYLWFIFFELEVVKSDQIIIKNIHEKLTILTNKMIAQIDKSSSIVDCSPNILRLQTNPYVASVKMQNFTPA